MSQKNIRAVAACIIVAVEKGASLANAFPVESTLVNENDLPLLRQLCYGTLRHYFSLCGKRKQLLSKPLKTKESKLNALILVGLYQLLYSHIPAYAAVAETVNAAEAMKKNWAKGMINAVLRNMQRQQKVCVIEREVSLTTVYDHPQWLIDTCHKYWPEHWQQILRANNEQAPMTLRVNQQHNSRQEYLVQLEKAGISARAAEYAETGITLYSACNVDKLPGFYKGWVSVQDEAAQFSATLLQCQPGQRVLDACAAPGGKTCHLLEHTSNLKLWAVDIDQERLLRIQENLDRLKLAAHLVCGDATSPESWWDGKLFDRILLDAPCSATGVIRRHPDIKLLRRQEDISELATLQHTLLHAMWQLLAPGGILVYATCSVIPEENSEQVRRFLSEQENATLQSVPLINSMNNSIIGTSDTMGLQFLPSAGMHDGFFYSVLKKESCLKGALQDKLTV